MDLDKMKKAWNTHEIEHEVEHKDISEMIKQKGENAIAKLNKDRHGWEFVVAPIIITIILIANIVYDPKNMYTYMFVLLLTFWAGIQYAEFRFLKNLNLSADNIIDLSTKVIKYKVIVPLCTTILFLMMTIAMLCKIFIDPILQNNYDPSKIQYQILASAVFLIILITYALYKYRTNFLKNIADLEDTIKEIQYFKEEK